MESYELAYRMQMEVPGVIDLKSEPEHIREAYGMNQKETAEFGRQCLMARRLVEKGVRFVQIFSGGWDSHDYLERGHSSRIQECGQTDDRTHQRPQSNAGCLRTRWSCGPANSAAPQTTTVAEVSTP